MAHRKWKETKQQPSMLPGPSCAWLLLSFFPFPVGHYVAAHCTFGGEIQAHLYEAVEAADLSEVRCLPDEEEADVAEVPFDFRAGNVGERSEVDGVAVLGGSLKIVIAFENHCLNAVDVA